MTKSDQKPESNQKKTCGIIMPISAIDGCTEGHWSDVYDILSESIEAAEFDANLVSNADDSGIIHKRIIQNLYENPVVVCDVSGKNPNVMFELGMRLAFDKPTIIVKDDKTSYSFDTSSIEHLEYPRDLRFSKVVEFKEKLSERITATHEKSTSDPSYTTFLKHFGEFTVAKIDKKEVSSQEFVLDELKGIRMALRKMEFRQHSGDVDGPRSRRNRMHGDIDLCLGGRSVAQVSRAFDMASAHPDVRAAQIDERGDDHRHLIVTVKPGSDIKALEEILREQTRNLRIRERRPDGG